MLSDVLLEKAINSELIKEAGGSSSILDAIRKSKDKALKTVGEWIDKVLTKKEPSKAEYITGKGSILRKAEEILRKKPSYAYSRKEAPIRAALERWWDTASPVERIAVPLAIGSIPLGTAALVGANLSELPPELVDELKARIPLEKQSAATAEPSKLKALLDLLATKLKSIGGHAYEAGKGVGSAGWQAAKGVARELYGGAKGAGKAIHRGAEKTLEDLGLIKYFRRRAIPEGEVNYGLKDLIRKTKKGYEITAPGGSWGNVFKMPVHWWRRASDAERALAALGMLGGAGYGSYSLLSNDENE